MKISSRIVFVLMTTATLFLFSHGLAAQTKKAPNQNSDVARALQNVNNQQKFQFRYRMQSGETIRWDVEHIASGSTKVGDVEQDFSLRTNSTKKWKITSVDSRGNITFEHTVERLNMWNKIGDGEPTSYDSEKTGEEVAPEFESAAASVGKVLAVITIDPTGRVVDRNDDSDDSSFGTGNITVPFPEQPIAINHQWAVPSQMTARHSDGRVKEIKWRQLYTLKSVENQIATIEFRSEILTPIEKPEIRAQVMQKMNKGTMKFHLAKGRMIERDVNWNEKVQGHSGADSRTEYLARYTVKIREPRVSTNGEVKNNAAELRIKPVDGKPIIRKH